jgi:hypothetical protein
MTIKFCIKNTYKFGIEGASANSKEPRSEVLNFEEDKLPHKILKDFRDSSLFLMSVGLGAISTIQSIDFIAKKFPDPAQAVPLSLLSSAGIWAGLKKVNQRLTEGEQFNEKSELPSLKYDISQFVKESRSQLKPTMRRFAESKLKPIGNIKVDTHLLQRLEFTKEEAMIINGFVVNEIRWMAKSISKQQINLDPNYIYYKLTDPEYDEKREKFNRVDKTEVGSVEKNNAHGHFVNYSEVFKLPDDKFGIIATTYDPEPKFKIKIDGGKIKKVKTVEELGGEYMLEFNIDLQPLGFYILSGTTTDLRKQIKESMRLIL